MKLIEHFITWYPKGKYVSYLQNHKYYKTKYRMPHSRHHTV